MSYHQKAIVCTSDKDGKGKAVFWEDRDGKVCKKTKQFSSKKELETVYKNFGFDDPVLKEESFWNFSIPSPFDMLSGFANSFFGPAKSPLALNGGKKALPVGIDIEKHRARLQKLQEKKREEARAEEEKRLEKAQLQQHIDELKEIQKALKDGGDHEGEKGVEKDIEKLEAKLKVLK